MRRMILNKNSLFFQFMIVFLVGALGCGKNDDLDNAQRCKVEGKIGADDDIFGQWKLIKGQTFFYESKTIDYSCNNIIYEFREDETLIISSDTETVIDLGPGLYSYQLHYEPLEASDEEFTLQIDGLIMGIEISTDAMIVNHSYFDGPILYFVRIR